MFKGNKGGSNFQEELQIEVIFRVIAKLLIEFEEDLKNEFMGEFENIAPSVEFGLPDETVIGKEMRILLDDGYKSEVEQKGHGLQP